MQVHSPLGGRMSPTAEQMSEGPGVGGRDGEDGRSFQEDVMSEFGRTVCVIAAEEEDSVYF